MNKKYLPSALILYLNYFIHGIGCSILGQAVIKDALAASWGVEAMAITAISAALGLGRLIALPFAGPLSDKLGRRISTAIGSASYAVYLIGLALAFNAGTNGGYTIAYVCAIIGGIANSFLDTGIYPAVGEIIYKTPGVATMGIKFFIAIAQMLLPFALGMAVTTTAAGLTSYNPLFFACGICYIVLLILVFLFPLPDADQKAAGKKEGLIASLKHTHFSLESIAMILIGFTCTGTFQLWLNCAQNFAKENAGWANPSIMQTYYSAGTMLALIVTAFLTRKIKDVRFIVAYPVICLVTMIVVLVSPSQATMTAGAFLIGWAGAGGLLQIATSVCNMLFPKIKGTVTALVMIASSLCNYTILTAASKMQPSQVMLMNIILTGVGVVLGLYVNLRYTKMVEYANEEN
ncbi:MFS transporter [Jingyaoa shaoxingensis]|uniref:MFS transporter n=1 Tax=Jingyaoa shaoxingensis TaxID=2763671 RepID=A0ABR7N5I6_9FIRM|nr:MFS transporter [Jingyaoa shaoxingensis]MBC8571644.1 MFS transporter [Jingyaoa shaoxingensis]